MRISIERKIQIEGMTDNQASTLKHVASYTPPKYMALKNKDHMAGKRHPSIQFADRRVNKLFIIPRGIDIQRFSCTVGAEIQDWTRLRPVTIACNIQPNEKQTRAIDKTTQHRGGVILVSDAERIAFAILLAVKLAQRCLVIVPSAVQAEAWTQGIERVTGEPCGVITTGKKPTEGRAFTVANLQALKALKTKAKRRPLPRKQLTYTEPACDYGMVLVNQCYAKVKAVYEAVNDQPARYRFGLADSLPSENSNDRVFIDAAIGRLVMSMLD